MAGSQPGTSFIRGLLNDFASLGVILLFVLVLTAVMGVTFVLVYIVREAFVYIGVFLSIILVPIVIVIGLYLNFSFYKNIPRKKEGFWKHFRIGEVQSSYYKEYEKETYHDP